MQETTAPPARWFAFVKGSTRRNESGTKWNEAIGCRHSGRFTWYYLISNPFLLDGESWTLARPGVCHAVRQCRREGAAREEAPGFVQVADRRPGANPQGGGAGRPVGERGISLRQGGE